VDTTGRTKLSSPLANTGFIPLSNNEETINKGNLIGDNISIIIS